MRDNGGKAGWKRGYVLIRIRCNRSWLRIGPHYLCDFDDPPQHGGRSPSFMSTASSAALSSSVLLLNRQYVAIHVVDVRRAFVLLFRELAEVIHIDGDQWANYDFESWREISELQSQFKEPHQDWIRSVHFEIQVPRVLRLLHYDRVPKQRVRLEPPQYFRPRRQPLPILRQAVCDERVEPGPHRSDVPRRRNVVGQPRVRVRSMQRAQGRPHAAGSGHEADQEAGPAEAQPAADDQARQSEVRELEDVLG